MLKYESRISDKMSKMKSVSITTDVVSCHGYDCMVVRLTSVYYM
jgi:hypothetical protein